MLLRLLTIMALVLMPIGMAAMPASAASTGHHSSMPMAAGHCDDMGQSKDATPAKMDCKAMCSAAAFTAPQMSEPLRLARCQTAIVALSAADGIEPEFDPPPPKRG